MNITECFPMRKRRSVDKTPGRSHDATAFPPQSPVGRLRRTPRGLPGSSCNNSFLEQSLEIVWDNNSPSPLSLGKRKKHESDSSSSGGEISDLVQKLADKSGHTPEVNPPLLAFWMSRDSNTAVEKNNGNAKVKGNNMNKQKAEEFQTPSRRPRRVLRKCNKSKMKLLKKDIELLAHPLENTEEEPSVSNKGAIQGSSNTEQQQESCVKVADVSQCTRIKPKCTSENSNNFSTTGSANFFDGWDTDEDDLILSQVEIPSFKNNIPETQVMTNTQFLDSGSVSCQNNASKKSLPSKDHGTTADVDTNGSIVTENWDFADELGDSDDENILQSALEDFEKSQQVSVPTVRRLSNLHVKPNLSPKERHECSDLLSKQNKLGQTSSVVKGSKVNSSVFQRNVVTGEKCSRKGTYNFIPRATLQSTVTTRSESLAAQQIKQHDLKDSNSLTSSTTSCQRIDKEQQNFQNVSERNAAKGNLIKHENSAGQRTVQKGTVASKPARYSKEDIERKKIEAQIRRRQKMVQSQQKHHS